MTPIFFDPAQSLEAVESFSPSAAKPARFTTLMKHYEHHNYGQGFGAISPVTQDDLKRAHHPKYVDGVFAGTVMNGFDNYDPRVPAACLANIGSLLAAAEYALANPAIPACSPSSGFHHAGYSEGGGYCTFNGLMVVVAMLAAKIPDIRIGILDLDVHFGNGTADIQGKKSFLQHRVMLASSGECFHEDADPDEFFWWLDDVIRDMNNFGCDLVLYQAGADMHKDDPLGGFLDDAQMTQRDRTVFCKVKGAIAWNLAGGYRPNKGDSLFTDPVLQTHRNTLRESSNSHKVRKALLGLT